MSSNYINQSIVDNLIQVMSIATQNSHHKESGIKNLNGSICYFTGCEFPFFNGVFSNYRNNESELIDNINETTQFFTNHSIPFIWWWTQQEEIPEAIKANLNANGFQFLGDFLGISAQLNEIKFLSSDDRIEIGIVDNEKDYQFFLDIVCEVFQMSETIKSDLKAMYKSYGSQGKFKHYLGYYQGEPVATLTSYINDSIVGLYNGATLSKIQKHGLCSALAHFAIKEALSLNCHYAVSQLMTPGMAKGASEKMGFQTHCKLLPFLKDPRLESRKD